MRLPSTISIAGLLLLLLAVFSCQPASLQQEEGLETESRQLAINGFQISLTDSLSLLPYLTYLPTGQSTPERDELPENFLNPSQFDHRISNQDFYWIRFSLQNLDSIPHEWLLYCGYEQEINIYGLDHEVHLGTMIPRKTQTAGLQPGFFHRDEGYSQQTLLQLPPGEERTIFIKGKRWFNKPLNLDYRLLSADFIEVRTQPGLRHFWEGIFQGMIWVLILYHLMLFITVLDATYLIYCVYMFSISMLPLADFGYWQAYLFPNLPFLGWVLFHAFQYISGILTVLFMQRFVGLDRLLPYWDRIVNYFIAGNLILLAIMAIYFLLTANSSVVLLAKILILPFAGFGLFLCLLLIRTGDTVARYFAFAGIILAVAIGLNAMYESVLGENSWMGTDLRRYYLIQIVVIIHLLTFALGMGIRRRFKDIAFQRTLELDRLKTRLYTNITHEFRTPLTVILGMSDQIKGHEKERKLIKRNSKNLLRLINQMLDLSKLESGKLELDRRRGNVIAYLQYLTESFYSMATDKKLRLTFYAEEEELIMDFDESKLQHIVYNLLSNAIKFTPSGGKVIFHAKRQASKGETSLEMIVKDTGVGIEEAKLPHIFDRFYQADDSTTRSGEGTGIGLALTKELVELMGGSISVKSQLDKGTTFHLLLPVTQDAPWQPESKPSTHQEEVATSYDEPLGATTPEHSNAPLVLIVEDNPDVVFYIQQILQQDYQLRVAPNGREGVELAQELIPDLVISDVMMPEMDGYQLCNTLKTDEKTSHIPIVLLTAKAAQEDKIAGLKLGADAFLSKPFDKEELLVRLEKLIELRRQLQASYASFPIEKAAQPAKAPTAEDLFLQKLESTLLEQIDNPDFGVPQLAKAVHFSQMQMYRKLKALLNQTPSQFIRSIRLRESRTLLQQGHLNVSEVAYAVGFADPNYFSRTFSEAYGMSPSEFKA